THSLHGDDTAVVDPARVVEIIRFLRDTPDLGFNQLIDLTCFDTLGLDPRAVRAVGGSTKDGDPSAKRFHVVYHLRSLASGKRLRVKAAIGEWDAGEGDTPEID